MGTLTLFIPSIPGQHKLWLNTIAKEATLSSATFQLGNFIGIGDHFKEHDGMPGLNEKMVRAILHNRSKQDNWGQLVGPNEIVALNSPYEWTNKNTRKALRDAWMAEQPLMYTALVHDERLITHGGLTYGEWVAIGRPQTAIEAAKLLNAKYAQTVYQGECFKLGNGPNFAANPIWAHPYWELYPSWVTTTEVLPFDQLIGSGSLNNPEGREAVSQPGSPLGYLEKIRYRLWGASVFIRGQKIISLDLQLPLEPISSLKGASQLYLEKRK